MVLVETLVVLLLACHQLGGFGCCWRLLVFVEIGFASWARGIPTVRVCPSTHFWPSHFNSLDLHLMRVVK